MGTRVSLCFLLFLRPDHTGGPEPERSTRSACRTSDCRGALRQHSMSTGRVSGSLALDVAEERSTSSAFRITTHAAGSSNKKVGL
jgi:hypothetical protein